MGSLVRKNVLKKLGAVLVCSEEDANYLNLDNVFVIPNTYRLYLKQTYLTNSFPLPIYYL